MTQTLRIGTRRSALAMWQTHWVQSLLKAAHPNLAIEIHQIVTQGDRQNTESLARIGGKGVFIKEIEDSLLRHEIDIAVHSMKDVPTDLPEGLTIGAIPERADVRDALVSRTRCGIEDLPIGSRVGTGSPRRQVQLNQLRPDLQMLDIRGNVDTRLRKLNDGQYDAILLASAGLHRLGWEGRIDQRFTIEEMVPAVGQAAVGVECRLDDKTTRELIQAIDHPLTSTAVRAERAFLVRLGGGCQQPIGATAWYPGKGQIAVIGMVATENCIQKESNIGVPEQAELVGTQLAERFR